MKRLYAPWRSKYASKITRAKKESTPKNECTFCLQFAQSDDDNHFFLKRTKHHVIMLNRYPYNAGHLLIVPLDHVATLNDLSTEARAELAELTNQSILILQDTLKPDGFNVGINIGKAGGAGIPSHIHEHILPRWSGDTNFLPALGQTKVISFDLQDLYQQLKPHFEQLSLS